MSSCSNQAPQGQATIPMTAAMQNKVLTQNLKDVRHKLFVMSGKGGGQSCHCSGFARLYGRHP